MHVTDASAHSASARQFETIIGLEEKTMWTKPDFTEMRFGFEITMYIGNR
ncbi:MAG: pyrroloquinoline quinone precursor peptide PqqA [Rhodospirillales bacterium]|nr:pyrroloquinoline quinone precursor peptide PqqA [Rhodospirillales bacterium]